MKTRFQKLLLVNGLAMAAAIVMALPAREASACGFKRFVLAAPPSFAAVHTADTVGRVFIVGDAVDRRLEYALRRAGHQVRRVSTVQDARGADVVLASAERSREVRRALRGSGTVVVTVVTGDQEAVSGRYVLRTDQRVSRQLVLLERAVRRSQRRA